MSPRLIFDPFPAGAAPAPASASAPGPPPAPGGFAPRAVLGTLVAFYRDRLSWLALAVTSAVLCYVGGLLMFWFHSVELGEGGPAISWYAHWLLDSTVAFVALTPALALIIPLAVHWSGVVTGTGRPRIARATYAVIAGGLFALATVPGPVVHNKFVGRGTWLADSVTGWIGDPSAPLATVEEYSLSALLSQQLGFAVAIYLLLTLLSVVLVRGLVLAAGRRTAAPAAAQAVGLAAAPAGPAAAPAVNADASRPQACQD